MILADKIIDLRKKSGWSQEELAEKLGVSRQSISKWEGAQSVPDMSRVLRLSEVFGVSIDYLLKDELEAPEPAEAAVESGSTARTVSFEEANAFLRLKAENARRVALGVMLCVLSPVLLLLLSGAREYGLLELSENHLAGIGLVVLILLVCGAVALFVTSGLRIQPYEYIEKEPIDTLYGVDGMVRERRQQFHPTYTRQLTLGIVLCVASVLPIFVALILSGDEGFTQVLAVGLTLLLVAVGAMLIVRVSLIWGSYQQLLEEGDYIRQRKSRERRYASISAAYWSLVTVGYLAYSFISGNWHQSWIVWPVAALAFSVVTAGLRGSHRKKD